MASLNFWYIENLARFREEGLALADLAARADWLAVGPQRIDTKGRIIVDFTIEVGTRVYEARLRYPTTFPLSPPTVGSRDGTATWSRHQYQSGDLCLEYRADNWTPEILGAQVVESAYRLLSGENPSPGVRAEVPSAHVVSEGQRLRGSHSRFLLTRSSEAILNDLAPGEGFDAIAKRFSFSVAGAVRVISHAVLPNGAEWEDLTLPVGDYRDLLDEPMHVRHLSSEEDYPSDLAKEAFDAQMATLGVPAAARVIVLLKDRGFQAYRLFGDEVHALAVMAASPFQPRLTADHVALSLKQVAVVGCGSLGSKVATSLARCGVRSFVLVDDDIFTPDNVVRHDLDWRSVGLHKADALASRLGLVHPRVAVTTRRSKLGGQESGITSESIIASIAGADLVIDATGVAETGNLLGVLRERVHVPILWGEVFAGGIGGLIARQRPGIEPSIGLMRRAIENWFADHDVRPPDIFVPDEPYARQDGEQVFVADDGDVSTIASAMTRLAVDTLLSRSPSHFPHSIYLIGMAPEGPFTQAFDTRPIELPPVDEPLETQVLTKAEHDEAVAMLGNMFGQDVVQ
ncbi:MULTISPECIES: ThiF family adenylyltransferase [unclassified Luteibacter]|uniref:ThiF family adenylyltransferase n=1 Tax=Luteibacter sp. PvP019 TaxID=3156436 RepID=UPI00339B5679